MITDIIQKQPSPTAGFKNSGTVRENEISQRMLSDLTKEKPTAPSSGHEQNYSPTKNKVVRCREQFRVSNIAD